MVLLFVSSFGASADPGVRDCRLMSVCRVDVVVDPTPAPCTARVVHTVQVRRTGADTEIVWRLQTPGFQFENGTARGSRGIEFLEADDQIRHLRNPHAAESARSYSWTVLKDQPSKSSEYELKVRRGATACNKVDPVMFNQD